MSGINVTLCGRAPTRARRCPTWQVRERRDANAYTQPPPPFCVKRPLSRAAATYTSRREINVTLAHRDYNLTTHPPCYAVVHVVHRYATMKIFVANFAIFLLDSIFFFFFWKFRREDCFSLVLLGWYFGLVKIGFVYTAI